MANQNTNPKSTSGNQGDRNNPAEQREQKNPNQRQGNSGDQSNPGNQKHAGGQSGQGYMDPNAPDQKGDRGNQSGRDTGNKKTSVSERDRED